MTEQCTAGCASNGNIPGLTYRSQDGSSIWNAGYVWRGSASFVTGAHSMKFGYQGGLLTNDRTAYTNTNYLTYRVNNGVANQLTMSGSPFLNEDRTRYFALFAQEQWTYGRWTLQGAVRYDNAWSYTPDLQVGPNKFIPNALVLSGGGPRQLEGHHAQGGRRVGCPGKRQDRGPGEYRQIPGSGPGRRHLLGAQPGLAHFHVREPDLDRRQSQLDPGLRSPEPCGAGFPGERRRLLRGDVECELRRAVFSNTYDPALLTGWGLRPEDWSFGASVQREIVPRVSMEVGYYRRWWGNTTVTDNLAVTAADFDAVQRDGAVRSAAARTAAATRLRPVQRRAGQVRTDRQLHHPGAQLRQSARALRRASTSPSTRGCAGA